MYQTYFFQSKAKLFIKKIFNLECFIIVKKKLSSKFYNYYIYLFVTHTYCIHTVNINEKMNSKIQSQIDTSFRAKLE